MTKEETKKAIAVMQAYVNGKEIEWMDDDENEWINVYKEGPCWNWASNEYRIKETPKLTKQQIMNEWLWHKHEEYCFRIINFTLNTYIWLSDRGDILFKELDYLYDNCELYRNQDEGQDND